MITYLYLTYRNEDTVVDLIAKNNPKKTWRREDVQEIMHLIMKRGLEKMIETSKFYGSRILNYPRLNLTNSEIEYILEEPVHEKVK